MTESIKIERYAVRYSKDGFKIKGVYVGPDIYSDNVLLMRYATRFIDSYDLKNIEFIKYLGFNSIKVTSMDDKYFYVTIEPSENYQTTDREEI